MLDAWCLMLDAWCLMLEAWGLMLDAWCLMLDAWTPARPIHNGFHNGGAAECRPPLWRRPKAASLRGWVWQVFNHQASSIKHQAPVLSPINTPQKLKHFWPDRYRLFFGARLFQISRFPDCQVFNFENVEFGRFGIINPVQNRLVSIHTVFRSLQNH